MSSMFLSLLVSNFAHAEDFVPVPTPYLLVQSWVTLYDQDENTLADPSGYGDPEDDIGFKLRRARAGFVGQSDALKYSIILGMSTPYDGLIAHPDQDIQIVDANFGVRPLIGVPLWVTAGVQKTPVSREQIMSSTDLPLATRAHISNWMVPNRDTGVVARYKVGQNNGKALIYAGVFNGNQSMFGDDNAGKMFVGRVDFTVGSAPTLKTYGVVDGVTIGLGGDVVYDQGIATDELILGGDLIVRAQGLALLAEVRSGSLTPTDTTLDVPSVLSETERFGYFAQLGYTVGSYELAARYASFDDNTAQDNAGDAAGLRAGVTWHSPEDAVRIGGGYQMRMEPGSDDISNDSAVLWMQFFQ